MERQQSIVMRPPPSSVTFFFPVSLSAFLLMKRGKVDNVSHQGTGQHYCGVIKPPSAEPMPEWRSEKDGTLIFDCLK